MKLITFTVPCYNSADYLERCIKSLLPGGRDIEIILVNDGSTDETPDICDSYSSKYPDIIKVIHKENGGHGDAVIHGLNNASGYYFKVVDSDDWLDVSSMKKILRQLRIFVEEKGYVDLIISNYVYEHVLDNTSTVMNYTNVFPQNEVFSWQNCKRFRISQYILMHSVIYRTELLKESELDLPKHTFYVDNLYVYHPLPFVQSIYYMNQDLYRYHIGRSDQSVNEQVMVRRVSQQWLVTKMMLQTHDIQEIKTKEVKLASYMTNHLSMMVAITSILLFIDDSQKSIKMHSELWDDLKRNYPELYYKIKYHSPLFAASFKSRIGRKLAIAIYRLVKRIYHFN